MTETSQACYQALENFRADTEAEGKIAFVKEHAAFLTEPCARERFYFGVDAVVEEPPWRVQLPGIDIGQEPSPDRELNVTLFPDEYLGQWTPIFLIRHPALSVLSWYGITRGGNHEISTVDEAKMKAYITLRWSRMLYEWFDARKSTVDAEGPYVIDADDVMTEPGVIARLCDMIGQDAQRARFSWAPDVPDSTQMIYTSSSVVEGKTSAGIDLDLEVKRWAEEFGDVESKKLER